MFGSRVLSRNVWDVVTMDYNWRGLPYLLDTYRQMTTINTNSYKLVFDREDVSSPYLSNHYLCSINILDIITTRPILTLKITELDAIVLIDNIIQFSDLGMNLKDVMIPIRSYNQSLLDYRIVLEHIDSTNVLIRILEYAPAYETLIERVSFVISDSILEDMSYCMYFSWIIDLDFDGMNEFDKLVSDITIDRISTEFYQ